jgi:hypothetical protein
MFNVRITQFGKGLEFGDEVKMAYDSIKKTLKRAKCFSVNEPVDLFGWSRGAVAALVVAKKLQSDSISIRFLGLIDPVYTGLEDKDYRILFPSSGPRMAAIPSNVKAGFIAYTPSKKKQLDKVFDVLALQLEDITNKNIHVKIYKDIGHSAGGFNETIGYDMWEAAKNAGCPLGENPYEKPK